ncbi:hypothetical protein R1flu_010172 [Riccia fluitans]|uniref:Uncharacterized protein n=1 Tax=Riccia fluitans TaxID=41844 RepID=A0ABD1Z484_9MARC
MAERDTLKEEGLERTDNSAKGFKDQQDRKPSLYRYRRDKQILRENLQANLESVVENLVVEAEREKDTVKDLDLDQQTRDKDQPEPPRMPSMHASGTSAQRG